MAQIKKTYPGKTADEIFEKVHAVMEGIARKLDLGYEHDPAAKTGKVSKMGVTGKYQVKAGEVVVDLSFPFIIPSAMKKKVEEDIDRKLAGLFS